MPGALVIKQIKPQKLKVDKLRLELLNGMKKAQRGMLKDFKETTKTWEHKVVFMTAKSIAMAQSPTVHVVTDDPIYVYVNNGTGLWGPKHAKYPIYAGVYTGRSSKKALSFQWAGPGSYRAKTKPRVIGSTSGGPTGPMVAFPYVEHPGIEPRKFDEEIQKKWEPRFKRLMEQAMKRAAKASGHGE